MPRRFRRGRGLRVTDLHAGGTPQASATTLLQTTTRIRKLVAPPLPRPKQQNQSAQPTGKGPHLSSSLFYETGVAPIDRSGGAVRAAVTCTRNHDAVQHIAPNHHCAATPQPLPLQIHQSARTGDCITHHTFSPVDHFAICPPQHDLMTTQHTQHTQPPRAQTTPPFTTRLAGQSAVHTASMLSWGTQATPTHQLPC